MRSGADEVGVADGAAAQVSPPSPPSYEECLLRTNVESWYPLVPDITMPTACIALDNEHRAQLAQGRTPDALLRAVDHAMQALGGEVFFVRTSARSAKDSLVCLRKQAQALRAASADATALSDNDQMTLLLQSALAGQQVRSAREAFELLTSSERVKEDLRRAPVHNVVVRSWVHIPIHQEWRAFVAGGRIVALSQYYSTIYFPQLQDGAARDHVVRLITSFWADHGHRLPADVVGDPVIVDFAVVPSDEEGHSGEDRVLIIELNPFGDATHACLFDWRTERAMLSGVRANHVQGEEDQGEHTAPIEVRVLEEPIVLSAADQMRLKELMRAHQ